MAGQRRYDVKDLPEELEKFAAAVEEQCAAAEGAEFPGMMG